MASRRHGFLSRECGDETILVIASSLGIHDSDATNLINRAARILRNAIKKMTPSQLKAQYEQLMDSALSCKFVVAIAGASGVGKTTLLHLLMGREAPGEVEPTIALNTEVVETVLFGNYGLIVLGFAVQERYHNLWNFGAVDIVLLLTDSTLANIVISSRILAEIKSEYPDLPVVVVANKQDKNGALDPSAISKIMQNDVHTMVAIDLAYREHSLRLLISALCKKVEISVPEGPVEEVLRFENRSL